MPQEEKVADALRRDEGYTLYDLVSMADNAELDRLDDETLLRTSPHILSVFLSRLDVDTQRQILRRFAPEQVSEIVSEMDSEQSAELVSEMREHRAVSVLNEMEPDDAADIVRELEDDDRDRLLKGMQKSQPEAAEDVLELLEYPEDTAGAIMNPHVATLRADMTIDEAISAVRKMRDEYENIYYLYVVDSDDVLQGVVSMRALLLAPKGARVGHIMRTGLIGLLAPTMDKEIVAHIMADTNFHTLPVVDSDGELLGIITHDDVIDIMRDENTEDIQKMAGAGADEGIFKHTAAFSVAVGKPLHGICGFGRGGSFRRRHRRAADSCGLYAYNSGNRRKYGGADAGCHSPLNRARRSGNVRYDARMRPRNDKGLFERIVDRASWGMPCARCHKENRLLYNSMGSDAYKYVARRLYGKFYTIYPQKVRARPRFRLVDICNRLHRHRRILHILGARRAVPTLRIFQPAN